MQTDRQTSKSNYRCTVGLLQEGKLSLHSLTGYPTCEQALVYSTKALQNVSSSSALKTHQRNKSSLRKRPLCFFFYLQETTTKPHVSITALKGALTHTQRSDTQLATKGLGSMFSWQDKNGKKSSALHFSMASCTQSRQCM